MNSNNKLAATDATNAATDAATASTTDAATNPPPVSLRVLTVNIHKGFAFLNRRFVLHELRDAVRSVGADLVLLQEVQGAHLGHSARVAAWPKVPHYEFLADQIWSDFAYGRNSIYAQGHHGNAVLSKYPIVRFENHDVSIHGNERRGMLHCTLDVPGHARPVHAICVHLGLREPHRWRQLEMLCELVRTEVPPEAPLVVGGDFNDWRHRATAFLQRCLGMAEVFVMAHGRAAKTFPAHFPMLSLDRIYVRNVRANAPVVLPRRPWALLSDHAPLAAELGL